MGSSPTGETNFILELSGAVYTLANRVSNVFCNRHLRGPVLGSVQQTSKLFYYSKKPKLILFYYVGMTRKARDWIANPDYAGSTPVTYSNFNASLAQLD